MKTIKMLMVLVASIGAFAFTTPNKSAKFVTPVAFEFVSAGSWSPTSAATITSLCPGQVELCGIRYDQDLFDNEDISAADVQAYVEANLPASPGTINYQGNSSLPIEVFFEGNTK